MYKSKWICVIFGKGGKGVKRYSVWKGILQARYQNCMPNQKVFYKCLNKWLFSCGIKRAQVILIWGSRCNSIRSPSPTFSMNTIMECRRAQVPATHINTTGSLRCTEDYSHEELKLLSWGIEITCNELRWFMVHRRYWILLRWWNPC